MEARPCRRPAIPTLSGVALLVAAILAAPCLAGDHQFTRAPATGIAPLWVRFTGPQAESGETMSYFWDFGDGATASSREVMHRYPYIGASKTYPVKLTLTVKDEDGHTHTSMDTWQSCVSVTKPTSTVVTLFWANWNDNTIRMCSSCGLTMGPSTVIASVPDVSGPTGLYISEGTGDYLAGAWVTWANATDNTIRSMEIGASPGKSYTIANAKPSKVNDPRGIQILGDRLFWANYGDNTIRRMTLKESGPQESTTIIGYPAVNKPTGLHVVVAGSGRFVYWANSGDNTIRRCYFDDLTTFPVAKSVVICNKSLGVSAPGALRVLGSRLYWANYGENAIRWISVASGTSFPAASGLAASDHVAGPTGIIVSETGLGWANFSANQIWNCLLTPSGSECASYTLAGDATSSGISGPGFMRYTFWNP
jgi:hypothetical protein